MDVTAKSPGCPVTVPGFPISIRPGMGLHRVLGQPVVLLIRPSAKTWGLLRTGRHEFWRQTDEALELSAWGSAQGDDRRPSRKSNVSSAPLQAAALLRPLVQLVSLDWSFVFIQDTIWKIQARCIRLETPHNLRSLLELAGTVCEASTLHMSVQKKVHPATSSYCPGRRHTRNLPQ